MLSENNLKLLTQLTQTLNKEEIIWASGYLAGLVKQLTQSSNSNALPAAKVLPKITIVYGTETGNAKKLATKLGGDAKKAGIQVKITGLEQYQIADLEKETRLLVIISTQGEGEPPLSSRKFYEALMNTTPALHQLQYSVLALGDSSYPLFCKTGEDVDNRLTALGARAFIPVRKCDTDYEEEAANWLQQVIQELQAIEDKSQVIVTSATARGIKKKQYYQGTVRTSINLNDRGSKKETYHIEIASETAVDYEAGDALGIIPQNKVDTVKRILEMTAVAAAKIVTVGKFELPIADLLKEKLNICYLLTTTVKAYATLTRQDIPETRMSLLDLLRIYPYKSPVTFTDVLALLTIQTPRLYSISSSPAAHGNQEIHITVAKNKFWIKEEENCGVCSEYISSLNINEGFEFYIHKAAHFKLPDDAKDLIMIGPGTGIAPFRSFLAERDARSATGKNWLFFGDQHFVTDFLYQAEIQQYLEVGSLQRLEVAFSRDQPEKIYVQHRIKERGKELLQWLHNGAFLYVCGTKNPMSEDVEAALLEVLQEEGNYSQEEAKAFLENLEEEGRYAKDVY